jgi:phosphoribosylamine--glycine ligase
MKVLVIGNGGREHALCRALATQAAVQIVAAPGNPGTAACGRNAPVAVDDVEGLVALARREAVDLVIPGPEAALVAGVTDAMRAAAIPCCGPSKAAARLEASKAFTRQLAARLSLPGPRFATVTDAAALGRALDSWDGEPPVIKADGLAAGKGVFLPDTLEACRDIGERLLGGELGSAGATVVLEERLHGTEASLFYACCGRYAVPLPHARDHKRLQDGDAGPNTGGMGAISPNPDISAALEAEVLGRIVSPTLAALEADGTPFCGFLFVGIMLTARGPQLLEFNVRLGDPEAQAILPRLAAGELLRLCAATAQGTLGGFTLRVDPNPTCAVVLTADGYPEAPRRGDRIQVEPTLVNAQRWLIHAGTRESDGALETHGGRVAAIVARGATAAAARAEAYAGVDLVSFDGMHLRRDIGA